MIRRFNISFIDTNPAVVFALRGAFLGVPDVACDIGDITDQDVDTFVSPTNSFGYMDGGVDRAYIDRWGWDVMRTVQRKIVDEFDGELNVGQATSVGLPEAQRLVVAPTMRLPESIVGTLNVYVAFRAALQEASQRGGSYLAVPGMGTGVGGMSPQDAARQMRMAYDSVYRDTSTIATPREVYASHKALHGKV